MIPRAPRIAIALVVLVFAAAPSRAEAPEPAEMPTLEELYRDAKRRHEEEIKRQLEAMRDTRKEAIEAYRDKRVHLSDYQTLVEILNEVKDEAVQKYRKPALEALLQRFAKEDLSDPKVAAARREIGLAVIDLMKVSERDEQSLALIQELLYGWWRVKATRIQFRAEDKLRERRKAHSEMKRYLQSDERE